MNTVKDCIRTIAQDVRRDDLDAVVEAHDAAFLPNDKMLLMDDLLASAGTSEAAIKLITRLGG